MSKYFTLIIVLALGYVLGAKFPGLLSRIGL